MSEVAPTSEVIAFGYLGTTAPDLSQFETFATDVLGMQVNESNAEHLLLRMDERSWRISVEPGPGGIAFQGWEVANAGQLDKLAARLEAAGVPVKEDGELAQERKVNGLIRVQDPDGNELEFFHGAHVAKEPFVSPLGRRFVTGCETPGDMGFGHIVLVLSDRDAAKDFYMGLLGYRLSDTIGQTPFLHVNHRHHSIALGGGRPGVVPGLNHFMLEVENLDMVGDSLDRVLAGGAVLTSTLGKHTNDRMISFYCKSPGGFNVEYGYAGRHVHDDVWTTTSYDAASFWGHKRSEVPANA